MVVPTIAAAIALSLSCHVVAENPTPSGEVVPASCKEDGWTPTCHLTATVTDHSDAAIPRADFYVAPDGKDTNPGGLDSPFATLERARNAVREKVAAGLTKDVLVLVRGGTYQQMNTLAFGPEDSGTKEHTITYAAYPGEKVVLSGGRQIAGWKKGDGNIWTAELPAVKSGQWYFRQLFINGRRAIRARTPNVDDKAPWWIVETAAGQPPFQVTVNGHVPACANVGDVEFICNYNNEGSRERLAAIDELQQVITITPKMKFNPKCFPNDWSLGKPEPGKACRLENALELLDQPGEWYLDRQAGVLHYWPRPDEDLTHDEVIAPVAQTTLLAVRGLREKPVTNVKFQGIHVECLDWPLPESGYMGLFSCNVATRDDDNAGHRFIDAAVEMEYAVACDFVDGGIAHVGANGLCLRDGTARNAIEGNEIGDIGGNGIGAGGCNVAGGHLHNAAPPAPGEYCGYRIANNYVHDCGADYFGGSGICLYLSQDSVVAHNLVHDTAYFGIIAAGSQDPKTPFCRDNVIEHNHVYRAMKTTVDGAGLYITFAYYGNGMLVRGNLIHDTLWNTFGRGEVLNGIHDTIPCHGLYLDGNSTGCRYEGNVVFRNAGGPLLFNSRKENNQWTDNLFQKDGTPPQEFIDAMASVAGLEPAYRKAILKAPADPWNEYTPMKDDPAANGWGVYQWHQPESGRGVAAIFRHPECKGDALHVKLQGVNATERYDVKAYFGTLAKADGHFYEGTFFGNCDKNLFTTYLAALGDLPILSDVVPMSLRNPGSTSAEATSRMNGEDLLTKGLPLQLAKPGVVWIVYEQAKTRRGSPLR
jgi:hypothetical protein